MNKYLVQVIAYYDIEIKANSKKEAKKLFDAGDYGLNDALLQHIKVPESKIHKLPYDPNDVTDPRCRSGHTYNAYGFNDPIYCSVCGASGDA